MTLGILAFAEGPISSLGKQDAVAVVTGQDIGSLTTGTVVASWNQTIAVSGNPLNIVQGTESVIADTIVSVSGENINSTVANVTLNIISNPIVQVSGQDIGSISLGPYGVTAGGQVSIDASSEPDLDIFTGNVSVVADANVSVTGQSIGTLTTGTATVDAVTLAPVLTNLLESNVSDVTVVATGEVVVTGQSIGTLTTGNVSVVANSTALPTGNIISTTLADVTLIQDSTPTVTGLTTAIGLSNSTAIYAWIEVDDSETSTWNEVDDAETSTWTEVDDSDTITWQDAA
tara:strand:- start:1762 stop:2625 length:864 start_codon:yes stop_codon:yes gene_type:complete